MTQVAKGMGNLVDPKLMDELTKSGVKYNSADVLMVTKNADGKLLWLEKGNPKKGLEHILNHSDDLLAKGVDVNNIPAFIKNDLLTQAPINTGRNANGLFADFAYNNQKFRLAYGDNGFIVSLFPIK